MKKFIAILFLGAASLTSLNSCNTYHSLSNASGISQLAGNPFIQNVAKSIVKNMSSMLIQNGLSGSKLNLGTSLSSLLSTAQAVSGFKNMLGSNYGISNNLIEKNYSKLNTLRDVVGMVAATGTKGFDFYKS